MFMPTNFWSPFCGNVPFQTLGWEEGFIPVFFVVKVFSGFDVCILYIQRIDVFIDVYCLLGLFFQCYWFCFPSQNGIRSRPSYPQGEIPRHVGK